MTHQPPHDKPKIGITLGDLNGIGPEVVIKALHDSRMLGIMTPVIYGSSRVLSYYKKLLGIEEVNYSQVKNTGHFFPKSINVVNCWEEQIEITPGKPTKESGKGAYMALQRACEELKQGYIDALVTAPIDKHSIHSEDFPFKGHTEFLASYFETPKPVMMMVTNELRVALTTAHIPLKDVASAITKDRLESTFSTVENSLKNDFGINKPKIAVLSLNPHAGDGGLIGDEDENVIKPVINDFKNKGKLFFGPFPADGFFAAVSYRKYDAVIAMYHDQGLIPFKSLAFETGVNFTAGLPVVRTSPDHGTAYNIAGKNQATAEPMTQAIFCAVDILKGRLEPSIEK
jgi:4-hydroxythreonine-4-phosphate dehydrogenase